MQRFWTALLDHAYVVLAHDADRDRMNKLQGLLDDAVPGSTFHIGHHDDGIDLILSAEANLHALRALEAEARSAPDLPCQLLVHWDADLLFGHRDPSRYPHDENGDILFRFAREGDILVIPRTVTYSMVFPSQSSAETFVAALDEERQRVTRVGLYTGEPTFVRQVEVEVFMAPTHAAITSLEDHLNGLAELQGGRADGWGFMQMRSTEAGDQADP